MKNDLLIVKDILKLYAKSPKEESSLICDKFRQFEDAEIKTILDDVIIISEQRYSDIVNTTILLENLLADERMDMFELKERFNDLIDENLIDVMKTLYRKYY